MPETLQDLMQTAAEHGYEVSSSQLARWRRKGLLPRAVGREGLGRGEGSVVFYPDGTARQLLALLQFRANVDRRLEAIGNGLWCAGYPVVDTARQSLIKFFRQPHDQLDQALSDFEEGGTKNPISRAATMYLPRDLKRLRRDVGEAQFPTLIRVALELFSGRFTGDWLEEEAGDFEILEAADKSLGAEVFKPGGDRDLALKVLQMMSEFLNPSQHLEAARTATDEELIQVRDEALRFWRVMCETSFPRHTRMPWLVFLIWFMVRLGSEKANALWLETIDSERFLDVREAFASGSLKEWIEEQRHE